MQPKDAHNYRIYFRELKKQDPQKKNGIVKIYYTNDYINLINIENMNENDFPDYKDISINDVKKISLRDIFKIIFGKML